VVHIDIVDDGRTLFVRDHVAQTQDFYPMSNVPSDMIDRYLNEYLSNNAYQCTVTRGQGRRWN
jgi:hypothetical protein